MKRFFGSLAASLSLAAAASAQAPAPIPPAEKLPDTPVESGQNAPGQGAPVVGMGDAKAPAGKPKEPAFDLVNPGGFNFNKVPPAIHPAIRAGWFAVPPSGPGYYSVYDCLTGNLREKAPPFPLPSFVTSTLPFFELDYSYIDKPGYEKDFPEELKRIRLGDNWMFSTGGQTWARYENQYNARLSNRDNDFTLTRARPYIDLWYQDRARLFVEGMFAQSNGQNFPPLADQVDRADFQNLFLDLKLCEYEDKPIYGRVGRQEMQFGSQRLIATPDWANTRTTFDGARIFRVGDKWNTDIFWVRPRKISNLNGPNGDDDKVNFMGGWATYKPKPGTTRDFYLLALDNANRQPALGFPRLPTTNYTVGSRAAGDKDGEFLYDFEGAMQFGQRGTENIVAGFGTAGVGYHWKECAWNPTAWAYYDYASGTNNPGQGNYNTFNQLFPFGHYYFGYVDAVGRQNIHDVNFSATVYPAKWLTSSVQFHNFWLASRKDSLYNYAGLAIRRDPTGRAGSFVGNEIDYIANFHLTKRADLFAGYSYLFGGEFLKNTAGPATGGVNSSLAYASYSYRW